jgi:hypothetical protein
MRIARQMKEMAALVRELVDVRITAGLGLGKVHGSTRMATGSMMTW